MNFSDTGRKMAGTLKTGALTLGLALMPAVAMAQEQVAPVTSTATAEGRTAPVDGKGWPVPEDYGFQDQYSPTGEYAAWLHDVILLPTIIVISLLVLFLLIYVMVRFHHRRNPVPSKTSHNTVIEVVWTLVPVLILVGIAIPSIDLLAKQFKAPPKDALTVKITGYQWYWGYEFPDNGGVEIVSKMLNEPNSPEINPGVRVAGSRPGDGPAQLEVDNRLVLPVGEPIRLQITAADVIHSFGVPALWFKLDAVPGRLNEKTLFINEPGLYYGQCFELCGVKHAYMPVAIEAVPRAEFDAWILAQGGTPRGAAAPAGTTVPAGAAAPAAAPAETATPATAPAASVPAAPAPAAQPAA